jgi:hypothetical protein
MIPAMALWKVVRGLLHFCHQAIGQDGQVENLKAQSPFFGCISLLAESIISLNG